MRIRKGNRKYQQEEWERRLQKKIEDAELTRIADLKVEVKQHGPDGDPRRDRRGRGGKGRTRDDPRDEAYDASVEETWEEAENTPVPGDDEEEGFDAIVNDEVR